MNLWYYVLKDTLEYIPGLEENGPRVKFSGHCLYLSVFSLVNWILYFDELKGQSVENRLYQSREIVNSDNPAHVLQAQANGGYVYHASNSQGESTRNDQSNAY